MIRRVLNKNKLLVVVLTVFITGSIVFALFPPLVLERIVNELTGGKTVLLSLGFLYFGILAVSAVFDAVKEILITVFGQKITREIRQTMSMKLNRLTAGYFTENESGKVTSRFVNDVDTVEDLFSNGIISMFTDVCKVVSIIIMIFVKSRGLGGLMLIVTPLIFIMTRNFQKRMLKAQLENRVAIGKVNNHVPETIKNIRMIQTFAKEKYMAKRYDKYMDESYAAIEKSNLYDSIYSPIIIYISCMVISVMMVMSAMGGGMQEFFGMSVGTAVAVIAYVGKVFDPLESIGMEIQNIQSAFAGIRRIKEFLSEKEMDETEAGKTASDTITFTNVDFGYNENQEILSGLSFEIKAGEKVTIAGRTGAGKSTIFRLLLGLYSPWQGKVSVFGMTPEGITEKDRRRMFGYVEQNFRLVPGNIHDQIALYDENISREQVVEAVKIAGLTECINELENGYETLAVEELFSQGQIQLLSIARAVVGKPKIMLLDEITANLDSKTERQVIEALDKASENRTVISISHRLAEAGSSGRIIEI